MYSSLLSDNLVPVDVAVDDSMIRVRFSGGLEIATPVARFPRLAKANPDERSEWRLIGRGDGIHWPAVDEDICVRTLLSNPLRKPISRMEEVPALIGNLLETTNRLNQLFAGRPFTPDGHLVGSIGEVVAEYVYGIALSPGSTPQVDGHTRDGKSVQVKLTGANGTQFGFRWPSKLTTPPADLVIALKLTKSGFEEVYNGPFPVGLFQGRKDTTNGQISITVSKLREINPRLLPQENSLVSVNRWVTPQLSDVA